MGAVGLRRDDGDAIMVGWWSCDVEDIIRIGHRSCAEIRLEVRVKYRLRGMVVCKVVGEKGGRAKRWRSKTWLGFEVSSSVR